MTSLSMQHRQWRWQRMSAIVLAACVLVHLGMIIHAVRGGLTAAEILGRTQGNWLIGAFYGIFFLACATHVPAGVANIAEEWLGIAGLKSVVLAQFFAWGILILGLRAVWGVVAA